MAYCAPKRRTGSAQLFIYVILDPWHFDLQCHQLLYQIILFALPHRTATLSCSAAQKKEKQRKNEKKKKTKAISAPLESYLSSFKIPTSDDMLIHMYVRIVVFNLTRNVFGEKISSGYPGCQRFSSRWGWRRVTKRPESLKWLNCLSQRSLADQHFSSRSDAPRR